MSDAGELGSDDVAAGLGCDASGHGNRKELYYNFNVIIAIGYHVNSGRATMFCIWSNRVLKAYIIKQYLTTTQF